MKVCEIRPSRVCQAVNNAILFPLSHCVSAYSSRTFLSSFLIRKPGLRSESLVAARFRTTDSDVDVDDVGCADADSPCSNLAGGGTDGGVGIRAFGVIVAVGVMKCGFDDSESDVRSTISTPSDGLVDVGVFDDFVIDFDGSAVAGVTVDFAVSVSDVFAGGAGGFGGCSGADFFAVFRSAGGCGGGGCFRGYLCFPKS